MVIGSNPVRCISLKVLMAYFENLLVFIIAFPIVGILILLFIPSAKEKLLKDIALNCSGKKTVITFKGKNCRKFFAKIDSFNFEARFF
jgi:hypothetical protein